MTGPYVPAVDQDGLAMWRDELGYARGLPGGEPGFDGWRRLYVAAEPAPFEHSDMCEDDPDDEQLVHIDGNDGSCLCVCSKCSDADGYCVCPACSRPASHPHAAVTS